MSDAAKRVGMSENDLRSVNNIPPRMLIKAGSTLLVPRSAKNETDVTSHVADNAQVSLAPELVTRRATIKARKGETVASIAKRYGLNSVDVAEWNSIGVAGAFKLGQAVVVYLPVRSLIHSGKNTSKNSSKSSSKSTGASKSVVKSTVKPTSRKVVVQPKKR